MTANLGQTAYGVAQGLLGVHPGRSRVGHHGETMRALLVTGFHSGTVPKAFAKLRQAVKRGEVSKANAFRAELHVVEHGIHDFIERELVGLLREAKRWKTADVELVGIEIGSNRFRKLGWDFSLM